MTPEGARLVFEDHFVPEQADVTVFIEGFEVEDESGAVGITVRVEAGTGAIIMDTTRQFKDWDEMDAIRPPDTGDAEPEQKGRKPKS